MLSIKLMAQKSVLQKGTWLGVIVRSDSIEIPFNFEIKDSIGKLTITIINGNERFKVNQIHTNNDSIFIQLPLFDAEIQGKFSNDAIHGSWIRHLGSSDTSIPFLASSKTSLRFKTHNQPAKFNISGKWETYFGHSEKLAIGEFKQIGNRLFGTFLTNTGDYRYLEGVVEGNTFYLSTFDGTHAYLFKGKIKDNLTIESGEFYSGNSAMVSFKAVKNNDASLPDSYSLTHLKQGEKTLMFKFPDLNGKEVSLNDSIYKNKVVLVQILGSWCPNCMDETAYLSQFYNNQKNKNVEIIGLSFERTNDFDKSKASLLKVKDRFKVNYPLLVTGYLNDKKEVLKCLPFLQDFSAFPTLIIIDKSGKVDKIHTGFSGPGTGEHFEDFKKEFEQHIQNILK